VAPVNIGLVTQDRADIRAAAVNTMPSRHDKGRPQEAVISFPGRDDRSCKFPVRRCREHRGPLLQPNGFVITRKEGKRDLPQTGAEAFACRPAARADDAVGLAPTWGRLDDMTVEE
jgi:hypothetical protein